MENMWEAGGWVGIVWRVTYEDKGMKVTLVPITVPGRVKLFLWKGAVTSMCMSASFSWIGACF